MAVFSILFVVLIGLAAGGLYVYSVPSATVSLKAPWEVSYTLNRFDIVLNTETFGAEGQLAEEALKRAGINNKNVEDALFMTLKLMSEQQAMEGKELNTGSMVVSVSCENQEKQSSLTKALNSLLLSYRQQPEPVEAGASVTTQEESAGEYSQTAPKDGQAVSTEEMKKPEERPSEKNKELQPAITEAATESISDSKPEESRTKGETKDVETKAETEAGAKAAIPPDTSPVETTAKESQVAPSDTLESQAEPTKDRAKEKLESQAAKRSGKLESQAEKIREKTGR